MLLQIYLHRVLVSDGDYGREEGLAGSWRRIYQVLAGLVGLGLIIWGAGQILETFWRALVNDQEQGRAIRAQGPQGLEYVLDERVSGQPGIAAKMLKREPHVVGGP